MTMMTTEPLGQTRHWDLYDDASKMSFVFEGELIGFATSQQLDHNHEIDGVLVARARPCSACRWFEVRIIRSVSERDGGYVVAYDGCTILEGETQRRSVIVTASPYTVIETLTQERDGRPRIPKVSRIALSEAAARDEGIEQAWIDRAV